MPRSTSARASRSARAITPPVGLQGKGSTNALVFGVMAAFSSPGVRRNSCSAFVSTSTGTAWAMDTRGP